MELPIRLVMIAVIMNNLEMEWRETVDEERDGGRDRNMDIIHNIHCLL